MSLTGAEWKLLHRVIDLVDQRRAPAAEGTDVERVKTLVMDVYRDQGIGVDEAVVEQAIRDASEPSPQALAAQATLPEGAIGSLTKAESQWKAFERAKSEARWRAQTDANPLMRLTERIEAKCAPLIAHRPVTDAVLAASMAQTLVQQIVSFKRLGYLALAGWSVALAGAAAFAWQVHALVNGGGAVWGAAAGFMLAAAGVRGAWFARRCRAQAGAHTLSLMRGQKALALHEYDNEDLQKGAAIAGHIVRGSLKPLEMDKHEAWKKWIKAMADEDEVVLAAWNSWDFSKAPMRVNDLHVLRALQRARANHPFHSLKRLRKMAIRRGIASANGGPFG